MLAPIAVTWLLALLLRHIPFSRAPTRAAWWAAGVALSLALWLAVSQESGVLVSQGLALNVLAICWTAWFLRRRFQRQDRER